MAQLDSQDRILAFDRRAELQGLPAAHVLVVGISQYSHLPLPTAPNEELVPVNFAARSAAKFADWIIRNQQRLAVPLATCRALLAPSHEEEDDLHRLGLEEMPCDLDNFMAAVAAWRRDGAENHDGMMILYFAGHALELTRNHPVLVFQNFGAEIGPTLHATVSLSNLIDGMAPSDWQLHIARQQFFFIDTDRIESIASQVRSSEILLRATDVFDVPRLSTFDDRHCCVLYATKAGGEAFAIPNNATMFNMALMRCLDGAAAVSGPPDSNGMPSWNITIRSLVRSIQIVLDKLNDNFEPVEGRQNVAWSIKGDDAVLVRIEGRPSAELRLRVEPATLLPQLIIELYNDQSEAVSISRLLSADPTWKIPAGLYRLRISRNEHETALEKLISVEPPHTEVTVKIDP